MKVHIINATGVGHDTRIYDGEMNDITNGLCIRKITLTVGDVVRADAELLVVDGTEIKDCTLRLIHNGKEVDKIIYSDGTTFPENL